MYVSQSAQDKHSYSTYATLEEFEEAVPGFNELLFLIGDCKTWLVATPGSVSGIIYGERQRNVIRSSAKSDPHTRLWLNRGSEPGLCPNGCPEDPWISTVDHPGPYAAVYSPMNQSQETNN